MADPRLLMVDELSLGLSPKASVQITQALLRFAHQDGLALLLVDQNVPLLRAVCSRVYLLRDGTTRVLGDDEELL